MVAPFRSTPGWVAMSSSNCFSAPAEIWLVAVLLAKARSLEGSRWLAQA
jgi:hypothetical protein